METRVGPKRSNKRTLGTQKEQLACAFLQECGYEILERNYRGFQGEIDIIAQKDGYVVFVEVKYRKNDNRGYPGAAVDVRKQRKISATAKLYLYTKGYGSAGACRFDVVEILGDRIRIIENAFDYTE